MKKAIIHLIIWAVLTYLFYVSFSLFLPWTEALLRTLPGIFFIALMFYLSGEVLAQQFLIKRQSPLLFGVLIFVLIFVLAVARSRFLVVFPGGIGTNWNDALENSAWLDTDRNIWLAERLNSRKSPVFVGLILNSVIAVIAVLLRLYEHKADVERDSAEKLQRSQEAQILYLKSQVNPHFLFNTLNNLYGLTYAKSDLAPQMVLGLSDTMRYLIYETEQKLVPIYKELDFIRNYLDLEKMRISFPENIRASVHVQQENAFIPPLLLLPFVENCFKHGTVGKEDDGWMELDIWDEDGKLYFICKNSFMSQTPIGRKGGIGLANVKKRLELIYGHRYELHTTKQDDEYMVSLQFPVFDKKDEL